MEHESKPPKGWWAWIRSHGQTMLSGLTTTVTIVGFIEKVVNILHNGM